MGRMDGKVAFVNRGGVAQPVDAGNCLK